MSNQILRGKVVVVGAGAKNLGGLISRTFGAEGSSVVVNYNSASSKKDADETVRDIEASGGRSLAVQGDLTRVAEIEKFFGEAVKGFGGVDIGVNCIGMALKKPIVETTEAEFDKMFAINTKAAYFFIREAAKRMNDHGKIISIGTSLLAVFTGLYSVYAGSKSPLEHFTRAAAKELGPRGISVNIVAPGPLDTPFFHRVEAPEAVTYHKSRSMNGKLGDIKDIVPIIKFLATEGWWITGQTIFANGGYTTR